MSDHKHDPADVALVTIGTRQDDGTGVVRRWYIRGCCAEALAAQLGQPNDEALVTPEAAAEVTEHWRRTPGVVITERT